MADQSEVIGKDIPEFISLLTDANDKITDVNQRITSLIQKVDCSTFSTQEGVSFLEMKYHLLLSYLINLVQYMLLKTNGRPIENSTTIDRMVELRTVMEKIRPIDQKLKYQVDKLIKIATTGITGQENDPLRFKPRPDNLVSKLEPTTETGEDDDDERKPGIYVPPKVAAMHFDDKVSKKRRSEEAARKKALNSSLLKELREEYSEAPEEITEGRFHSKSQEKDEDDHRQRYEEDNFVRLLEKKNRKSNQNQPTLSDLTKFTDLSILTKKFDSDESPDEGEEKEGSFNRKKRKSKSSGKLKKNKRPKGFFKRQ